MNVNVNDISGFDATAEEIRQVYAERDQYKAILDEIKKIFKMGSVWTYGEIPGFVRASHDWLCEKRENAAEQTKQLTEDIGAALGVRSDMRTRESILGEISKLRRGHENHKYTIKRQEEFTEEAASILGVDPGDLSLSDILTALRKLKRCEELNDMNSSIIADLKTEHDKETSLRIEAERYASTTLGKICSALGIEYSTDTTLEYILGTIDGLKGNKGKYSRSSVFSSVCDYLGFSADDATLSDIHDEIKRLKEYESKYRSLCNDVTWYYMELDLNDTQRNRAGVMAKINEMKTHMYALQESTARHDRKRREWVRKYESEHERANSCDRLYKKYKALYDADADKRKKLSDNLQSYSVSYEAVRNKAIKYRSLMNAAKKKANHWDILVENYGEGTMRILLENIGIDVSGDKGNGLFG